MKKKTKRVDSRSAIEGEQAARWQQFSETGAPLSLVMLLLFAISAALFMTAEPAALSNLSAINWTFFSRLLSMTLIMLVLGLSLGLYVAAYRPSIVKNYLRGFVLLTLLLIMIAVVRVSAYQGWSPYLIVVPVMVTAIIVTIAYGQRFALGIGSFLLLAAVPAWGQSIGSFEEGMAVLLATGGGMGISILSLREIRSRSKLIVVSLVAGGVIFALAWGLGTWQSLQTARILSNSLHGALGAVAVGFIMQGILPLIERVFHTATDMTLLDYSESNRPLLKRLAVEAPGTFNHSWQIGMMAEAAAEAIGANGLLCRVGSYYHDIGKLNKPRFFVENQGESFNQHKDLSPTMSKMIIIGHVKDGLEMAQEYKLPKVLHQFIATHHGTTLVAFFYHEASKSEGENGRTLDESDFRYPGPKPQNKETGIVMLCDAVEGATRALTDPTPNRIESTVNGILMKRLLDGQFDECDLTMRELHLIEARLVKTLCGMYHGRIAYPKSDKAPKEDKPRNSDKAGNGDKPKNVNNQEVAQRPT